MQRIKALLLAVLLMNALELAQATATPALYANHVSKGKWVLAPHLCLLDKSLTDIAMGKLDRLIVTMPPRHGKSQLVSRYFPAWFLGNFPDKNVIFASYAQGFASKWGRGAKNLTERHGQEYFGISVDKSEAVNWTIADHEGGMITAGVGGPITGQGAHLLIIDDPVKNAEEANSATYRENTWDWLQSTAYTRLEPQGACVLVQTRWHIDDLAGRLIAEMNNGGEKWRVLNLPAIAEADDELGRAVGEPLWPERYDLKRLEVLKRAIGTTNWLSLFQQRPIKEGGDKIKSDWFRYWQKHGDFTRLLSRDRQTFQTIERNRFTKYMICDAAGSSEDVKKGLKSKRSSSCIQCWLQSGSGTRTSLVLLDQIRGQWEFPELVRRSKDFIAQHKPAWFGAEDEKTGRALNQQLKADGYTIKVISHEGKDKLTRAASLLVLMENGQVYFPVDAPWMHELESEFLNWTGHPDDPADQIDTAAYAGIQANSGNSGAWGGVLDTAMRGGVLSW